MRLDQMRLAFDLMFTTRGVPLVYYGDEQGFTGDGGDRAARQTMFPTVAPEYLDDDLIGSESTHADEHFDQGHPLYAHIRGLAQLRDEHPALVTGAQITRKAEIDAFAFSRIDRDQLIEYVVATNRGNQARPITLDTHTPEGVFTAIHPAGVVAEAVATNSGTLSVDLPPRSTIVMMADRPITLPADPMAVSFSRPSPGVEIPTFRYRLEASLSDDRFAEVTFSASVDGGEPVLLGVDDAPPYRVYWDNTAHPDGASVEFMAVVNDFSGRHPEAVVRASLGERR